MTKKSPDSSAGRGGPSLVLASASPRRLALLRGAGLEPRVIPSGFEEVIDPAADPRALAIELSIGKAVDVARGMEPGPVVLAADTFILLEGEILGKPAGADDARRMLRLLSGRAHEVITGVALIDTAGDRETAFADTVRVYFRQLSAADIDAYVATGEPLDKAGAYAIQGEGAALVERCEGDITTVIGLPMALVTRALEGFGVLRPEGGRAR